MCSGGKFSFISTTNIFYSTNRISYSLIIVVAEGNTDVVFYNLL